MCQLERESGEMLVLGTRKLRLEEGNGRALANI